MRCMEGQKEYGLLSTYYGMCQALGWAFHIHYFSHLVLVRRYRNYSQFTHEVTDSGRSDNLPEVT